MGKKRNKSDASTIQLEPANSPEAKTTPYTPIAKMEISGQLVNVFEMLPECKQKQGCFRFRLGCAWFPLTHPETGKLSGRCVERVKLRNKH